uniref:Protein FAR1-RELATED SEQUENCE n=1 Tax=Steinernema glaseri TaxID=37863 RepID=A0A1I8APC2_9BILA
MYCLKGRPGRHVNLRTSYTVNTFIDSNCIHKFFEHWKVNGNLNFTIECDEEVGNPQCQRHLPNFGQVTKDWSDEVQCSVKHETAKTLVYFFLEKDDRLFLQFLTCECH